MAAMATAATTPMMEKATAGVRDLISAFSTSEARYFDEERFSEAELRKGLADTLTDRKIDAMKRILAAVSVGRDCSKLFPDVVMNVSFQSLELKKLIYIYLVQYAEHNRDLALLSINSFQKDLMDRSQLVRASALRAMASIKVLEVIQLVMVAVRTAANDSSPYVRKTAAQCTTKVYAVDPDQFLELRKMLLKMMSDRDVTVVGSAIVAFHHIAIARPPTASAGASVEGDDALEATGPEEQLSHLHTHFRRLSRDVLTMDAWAQQCCLDMLTRYCRLFFARPGRTLTGDEPSEEPILVPEDLSTLLKSLRLLLSSSSKAVTLAAVVALCDLAPAADLKVVTLPMLRCIRQAPPESARALFVALLPIVEARPELLRSSIREFFVFSFDFADVKKYKLKALELLVDETNVQLVLRELQAYVSWQSETNFVALAVQTIAHVALKISSVADSCLRGLVKMLDSKCEALSCEAVVALRALLQRRRETADSGLGAVLPHLAHHLQELKAPTARASVVWIIAQYQREVPTLAPDVVRKLAKSFATERTEVKQQILGLALKVWAFHSLNARGEIPIDGAVATEAASTELGETSTAQPAMAPTESAKMLPRLEAIIDHVSEIASFDAAWDVRDTARVLKKLRVSAKADASLEQRTSAEAPPLGLDALGAWYCKACVGVGDAVLPQPSIAKASGTGAATGGASTEPSDNIPSPWALGSLAQALDFPLETYRPLPRWAEENSPDELRTPKVEVAKHQDAPKSISSSNVGNVQHIENRVQAPSNISNMPVVQSLEDLDLFYSADTPAVPSRGPAGGGIAAKGTSTAAPAVPEMPRQTLEEFSLVGAPRPPPAVVGTAVFGEDDESDEDEESDDGPDDDDDWKYCAQASPQVPSGAAAAEASASQHG